MVPRVLTIAGSDPSGGAGIQADLKAFTALRVYGMSAITAMTVQNTRGVTSVVAVDPGVVRAQIDAIATDIRVDAAKTGMLVCRATVIAVADALRAHGIDPLVVDPVLAAGSGGELLDEAGTVALRERLLPLATVVTPNAPEAAVLTGRPVGDVSQMRAAARRLVAAGAGAALVTGGHVDGPEVVDVFFDGRDVHELRAPRLAARHAHGTGCLLSAAISAALARGAHPLDAVRNARSLVAEAIAAGLPLGHGAGPANPLVWLERRE